MGEPVPAPCRLRRQADGDAFDRFVLLPRLMGPFIMLFVGTCIGRRQIDWIDVATMAQSLVYGGTELAQARTIHAAGDPDVWGTATGWSDTARPLSAFRFYYK
jgi:hypothetical protein